MAEYIDREAFIDREADLNILSSKNAPWDGYQKVADLRIADVVSKAAYDQVAWERHLAEVQLKSIGKSLGEKMDDVQPVKHGRWVESFEQIVDLTYKVKRCSICGKTKPMKIFGHEDCLFNYCPNCGAKMDGEA